LSVAGLDRAAHRRDEPHLVQTLVADPSTRVAAIRRDRMLVTGSDASLRLVYRAPEPADAGRLAFALGQEPPPRTGNQARGAARGRVTAYLGVVEEAEPQERWVTLRQAGPTLGAIDASVFTTTLALANWHVAHGYCAKCGAPSEPVLGGWVRRCSRDGSEHFPRTDPAVIMAVIDADDRLLLGRGRVWPERQFSVLAGFVEPGESFAGAVAREVFEESGIVVTDVRYLGDQPWPFPSSIMVGCTARALTTQIVVDSKEMAEVVWMSREEYAAALRAGAIRTPGGISIARRLIERWLGTTVEDAAAGTPLPPWRAR
jgi:NAD+ diphosphatase